ESGAVSMGYKRTPLGGLNKKETGALGYELCALFYISYNTLPFSNGIIDEGCGTCPACQLRQNDLDAYLAEKGERHA
ncbi:7-cyano-7-deazaguanine synthase, partial [Staphylococcus chromogenes]